MTDRIAGLERRGKELVCATVSAPPDKLETIIADIAALMDDVIALLKEQQTIKDKLVAHNAEIMEALLIEQDENARLARMEEALREAPKLAHFMDSWICEMMDNETICTALREMKEWDALCAFQDMLREHKEKCKAALADEAVVQEEG